MFSLDSTCNIHHFLNMENFWFFFYGCLVIGQHIRASKCFLEKHLQISGYRAPSLPALECEHYVNVWKKNYRNHMGFCFSLEILTFFAEKKKAAPLWLTALREAPTMELICSIFFERSNRLCLNLSRPEIA